eukprot:g3450.t1
MSPTTARAMLVLALIQCVRADDYERVTSLAYFSVIAFPLLICSCCVASVLWGCCKNEYKSLHMYKEDENEGLFKVSFDKPVLGFEMRRGLIVRVGARSSPKIREGDRLWMIEDRDVQGWSDKRLIKELMNHSKRPLTLTFLRPNNTNPDVRHGIVATETKRFHAVTKGNLKGLPSFASFAAGSGPAFSNDGAGRTGHRSASNARSHAPPGGYARDAPGFP